MKKKKWSQKGPVMTIIDTLVDSDIEVRDNKTFEVIEKHIIDFSKLREFDCLFMSGNKSSANELCESLKNNLDYNTEKPFHDEDGWITHAVKQILYSDIKDTLKKTREEAVKHSSELFDWMLETDRSNFLSDK
jgi:hypothetical protein